MPPPSFAPFLSSPLEEQRQEQLLGHNVSLAQNKFPVDRVWRLAVNLLKKGKEIGRPKTKT